MFIQAISLFFSECLLLFIVHYDSRIGKLLRVSLNEVKTVQISVQSVKAKYLIV